ncbi:exo 1,3/1,4-beta-D-glucan glucohydrolase [Erythrobacter sp. LQ02-29]|uniref:glycoside hydrolase family 3 protein n=1 Tax=Erythrobacter sp. LQ02-29 TaxID=2920384 RepID=UPI001F4D5441|nr:glycoside hydrolase family 3 protein [Erythrobacter sp. LQ02-29]MCP9221380.1 exo 1,3/1,4-beta-D-glucan glucohydrolase [Erythrobacter sp. LQ02-29]
MRTIGKALGGAALLLLATTGCTQLTPVSSASQEAVGGAMANAELWPAAHSPRAITSPETEAKIDRILRAMTVRQKVGQVIQADISTITPADLADYPLGSILAGGNSGPYENERSSAADWDRLVREFRAASMASRAEGVAVPILFGVDAVHGHNNIPNATLFPHNVGLGAAHDPEMIRRIGAATAAEIAGSGIEWTFAPTLAVPQDLRWGRAYEGYSSDPALVASYAREMVLGLQGELREGQELARDRVAATAKHFLADGGTQGGRDQGNAKISEAELIATHAQGYPAAIDAGALTVMASFSSWNGVKNHGNRSLLTDVLKRRMGFQGLVVGDWNGHGQVDGCTVTDCPKALEAGLDLFMAPDSWKGLFDTTLREVQAGEIPTERLDDAVRRILRVKAKLGLLDNPPAQRRDYSAIGAPDHLALAREAVAKSLVLLKNNGSVLPIKPGARVLVAGPGADDMAAQAGGWTISWQGTDVTHADFTNGQTIWEGSSAAVKQAGGTAKLSADGSFDQAPDVAIVVFGEAPYAEFQGDVPTLDYQPGKAGDLALLKRLKDAGIPVVSVFLSGRPMFTSPEINASDAFVAAWLPGSQGAGVADVLVARADGTAARDFTGRLSFPWPADARSPIDKPLFAMGYGLDYAAKNSLPQLSEDPGMDVAAALNVANFFAAGRAQDPWSMTLTDAGGARAVGPGTTTSARNSVVASPVDFAAQEDAKAIVWSGEGAVSIDGPAADLSRQLNNAFALRIDGKVDKQGPGRVLVALGNRNFDVTDLLARMPIGQPMTLKIPLRCFADAGADLSQVGNALRITADSGFAMTLAGAKVEAVGEDLACPVPAQ